MSFEIPKTMQVVGIEKSKNLKSENLMLCCGVIDERFSEYYVMTNKKNFEDSITNASNKYIEEKTQIFKKLYENINKYSDKELNKNFNKKNNDWTEWCDDFALFYAYRHLLFPDKPIPIAHPSLANL